MRVLGFERPHYSIALATVGQFNIQCAREGSGQLSEGVTDREAVGLYMYLGTRPSRLNGIPIDPGAVVYFPPGSEFCFSCVHANSWFSVRAPLDALRDHTTESGKPLELLDAISLLRPNHRLVHRLRRMVPGYLSTLSETPALAHSHAATQAFESEMLAIANQLCYRSPGIVDETREAASRPLESHTRIATDAADIIESTMDGLHTVAGVAHQLDVSVRTLTTAFVARFGMSPRQYFQSMRLNKARQLLRQADKTKRVAEVAAECGYWDGSRFASRYQKLFGELPSETLQGALNTSQ